MRRDTSLGAEQITISVHDTQGRRLAEYDKDPATGALSLMREYVWLDGWTPFAVIEGGQVYHLVWDRIGRPVAAFDSLGQVVWQVSYAPFGGLEEVLVDTLTLDSQSLRFPGQWFQSETGLHQNWHRDYNPSTGRYLQADPLGLVDGPSVYGYVGQRPLQGRDPFGLFDDTSRVNRGNDISVLSPSTPGLRPKTSVDRGGISIIAGGGVAVALAILNANGGNDGSSTTPAPADGDDDCCRPIYEAIDETVEELINRFREWYDDKRNLRPGESRKARRRGTYSGHVQQIWNFQRRLSNLIDEAESKGCMNYRGDAPAWRDEPLPFNGLRRWDEPNGMIKY